MVGGYRMTCREPEVKGLSLSTRKWTQTSGVADGPSGDFKE
ncbi:hypothetical protein L21SP2_2702 [Salinispira pacifica]|uniref:Uncharacterized protein n=1 Tax=Salinispira pacifica TaxID=1307761 RepID=V5WKI8_9SPIO|nr:hypothetical protein L21SP2_2702 [Salinispira pacifica]